MVVDLCLRPESILREFCEKEVQFHFYACMYPFFLTSFIEGTIISPLSILGPVVKYLAFDMQVFTSGLPILFHWSLFLFLCQCYTVLITVVLKLGSVMFPTLFFFLRIVGRFNQRVQTFI